jgi:hypothetical protein
MNSIENKLEGFTAGTGKTGWRAFRFPGRVAKRIILLFAGILAIVLFFLVPPHKKWLKERLVCYWNDFLVQRKQQDIEQRKIKRFKSQYTVSKQIADLLAQKGNKKTALVLLPSSGYFKKNGIHYEVPDPGVFYYFTDLKTVLINNSNAATANWYVRVYNKKIVIDSVTDINRLKDTINYYRSIN